MLVFDNEGTKRRVIVKQYQLQAHLVEVYGDQNLVSHLDTLPNLKLMAEE